jgi:hypothetical protein
MDVKPNTIGFIVGLSLMMQHQEPFGFDLGQMANLKLVDKQDKELVELKLQVLA